MKDRPELIFRVGKRVNLRLIHEDDVQVITGWMNDEEVTRHVSHYLPASVKSETEWIQKLEDRTKEIIFGIETSDGQLIGLMGVHNINWRDRTASTGALIGEKEYWGKGYGSEAKMLKLKYAFDVLNLRKICSTCIAFNERALRYQQKCGYQVEGRRKNQHFADGKYWDEILLAVYREGWFPIWERYLKTGKV